MIFNKITKTGEVVRYGLDGKILAIFNLLEGKKHGEQKYFKDGVLYTINHYINGVKEGIQETYNYDGTVNSRVYIKDGKEQKLKNYFEGINETWYEKGKLRLKETFLNKKREGTKESYFYDGSLCELIEYKNGKRHGRYVSYYEKDIIRKTCFYRKGKLHGECKFYNLRKGESYLGSIDNYFKGKKHGISKCWEDKVLVSDENYCLGNLHGRILKFFPNGKIKSAGYFYYGKPNVYHKEFYENGDYKLERFSDGIIRSSKEYYSNKQIKKEIPFENGLIEGVVRSWDRENNLISEENYKCGEFHGECKQFKNNKITDHFFFNEGKFHGTCISYLPNGKLEYHGIWDNGVPNGRIQMWNKKGEVLQDITYLNGKVVENVVEK